MSSPLERLAEALRVDMITAICTKTEMQLCVRHRKPVPRWLLKDFVVPPQAAWSPYV